jgi:hypothetical protein
MRSVVLAAGLVLCTGCDGAKSHGGDAPTAAPPAKPRGPHLVIADADAPVESMLAVGTEGESAWRVTLGTGKLDCDALRAAYPGRPNGGKQLDFWLSQPVGADGGRTAWAVRGLRFRDARGDRDVTTQGAMVDGVDARPDGLAVAGLELAAREGDRMVGYSGDAAVKTCGRVPRPEPDRPQPELTLEVAGERIAVRGATLRHEGPRRVLRLTRAPHACETIFPEGYDFVVDLVVGGTPERPKLEVASLQGELFPEDPSGAVVDFEVSSTLDAPGEVELVLRGKLDLRGWPVRLDGKVRALRCVAG